MQSLKASACIGSAALCWNGLWCGEALGVCLATAWIASRKYLGSEWQVTRVMVTPSTNTVVAFLESSWLRSGCLLEEFSPEDRSGSTDQVQRKANSAVFLGHSPPFRL